MTGAMQQQLLAARRYNNSGQAVRYDGLIKTDTRNAPLRGKSCWRKWLPETILRAAFSKVSNRDFARSAQHNHSTTALGKVHHSTVSYCKKASATAIMAGEKKGLDRIWGASLSSALNFWITGHVADETKLWYIVPGQLQDDGPILDEDAFRTPEAMTHYSAAVQYHILSADGCAGVNPQVGLRPQARFYGTNIVWDSHRVNKLTAKYLRLVMDPEHLLLPSYCLQHHTGEVRQPAPPVLPPDCGRQPSYCLARYMSRER